MRAAVVSAEQMPPPTGPSTTTPTPTPTTPAPTSGAADHAGHDERAGDGDRVDQRATMVPVPPSFLGFSTEYWALPIDYAVLDGVRADPVRRHGPRSGTGAADRRGFGRPDVLGAIGRVTYPIWAYGLTPAWMQQTAALIAADDLHVILDVNHISGTPQLAAALVSEAEQAFPAGLDQRNRDRQRARRVHASRAGRRSSAVRRSDRSARPTCRPRSRPRTIAPRSRRSRARWRRSRPNVPLMGPALAIPQQGLSWIDGAGTATAARARRDHDARVPVRRLRRPDGPGVSERRRAAEPSTPS